MSAEQGGFEPIGYVTMTPDEVYLRCMFTDVVGRAVGAEQSEAQRATAADVGRAFDVSFNSGDYVCQSEAASLPEGFAFSARAIRRFGYPNEFAPIEPDNLWVNVASPQGVVSLRVQMPARLDMGVEGRSRSPEELLPPRSSVYLRGGEDTTVKSVLDSLEDGLVQIGEPIDNVRKALASIRYLANRSNEIDLTTGFHALTNVDVAVLMDFLALFMRAVDCRDIYPDREAGAYYLAPEGVIVLPHSEMMPPAYGRNEPAVLQEGLGVDGRKPAPGGSFEPGVYEIVQTTGAAALLGAVRDVLNSSRESITARTAGARRWLGRLASRYISR